MNTYRVILVRHRREAADWSFADTVRAETPSDAASSFVEDYYSDMDATCGSGIVRVLAITGEEFAFDFDYHVNPCVTLRGIDELTRG